eukprot:GSChrysophyteH2.ASY1.ANO1.662.1 assembled CDS
MSSVRKRSRPIEDSSFNELSSSTLDLGASGSKEQRRLALDLDELQLSNEQLVDKVRTLEEDLQHCKDKSARQLLFLEEENEKLRKTAADIKERYFEEKKKWQKRLRESQTIGDLGQEPSVSVTNTVNANVSTQGDDENWEQRLEILQSHALAKSHEVQKLSAQNAELNLRLQQLEHASSEKLRVDTDESVLLEARELRQRCGELEADLRRSNKQIELHTRTAKNQTLLEQELNTFREDAKTFQELKRTLQMAENRLQTLEQEKLHWNSMFQNVMRNNNASSKERTIVEGTQSSSVWDFIEAETEGPGTISPEAVLHALSKVQQESAVLLQSQMQSAADSADTKRSLKRAHETESNLKKELKAAQEELIALKQNLDGVNHQSTLYTGEIQSLRSLVSSYEAELAMGKPDTVRAFEKREAATNELRSMFDAQREQLQGLLQSSSHSNVERNEVMTCNTNALEAAKQEIADLREYQYHFEVASGMDFIPGRSKVFHMIQNPYQQLESHSTIPPKALKLAKAEIKMFRSSTNDTMQSAGVNSSINTSLAEVNTTASATTPKSRGLAAVGADSHKLNQRLKEMFRDRIQAFREGVYLLTGYKVDLIYDNEAGASKSKPKLRLRSMYAESPDDSLLFQWSGDRLDLIETPFARKLDARLLENLQRCNSVPLFVSAITSELFENQTFVP